MWRIRQTTAEAIRVQSPARCLLDLNFVDSLMGQTQPVFRYVHLPIPLFVNPHLTATIRTSPVAASLSTPSTPIHYSYL